jgi:hypothetical protein
MKFGGLRIGNAVVSQRRACWRLIQQPIEEKRLARRPGGGALLGYAVPFEPGMFRLTKAALLQRRLGRRCGRLGGRRRFEHTLAAAA